MPPKERLTKEVILSGAFELLRREGYEALNARSLAGELGCSTMPLFRQFESMEEIRAGAVMRGVEQYSTYIQQGLQEEVPFKGVGRAYIRFAREEPKIFQLLFMTPKEKISGLPETDPNYNVVAACATSAIHGSADKGARIYQQMWVFVHGIATMIVNGTNPWTDAQIGEMTGQVFAALKQQEQREGGQV